MKQVFQLVENVGFVRRGGDDVRPGPLLGAGILWVVERGIDSEASHVRLFE